MEQHDSPYVWRDEVPETSDDDPEDWDTVIVEGRAMSYRAYRETVEAEE